MTAERKRWWRKVAIVAVSGGALAGGWFGYKNATAQPEPQPLPDSVWTRTTTPTPAPTVAEDRPAPVPEPAPATGGVVPAGAYLPVPAPGSTSTALPAVPVAPPVFIPNAPLPVPPSVALPVPSLEPAGAGPRIPDVTLVGGDKPVIPAVPALPALPSAEPPVPPKPITPPNLLPTAPVSPVGGSPIPPLPTPPALPPLPGATPEPPRAPIAPAMPPGGPVAPVAPVLPQPTGLTPSLPPKPIPPMPLDSGLKPTNPGTTLNPTVPPVSPVAPAVPIMPPGGIGREAPGTPVDRPKPTDTPFGPSEKFVFPLPGPNPYLTPREDIMIRMNTAAAFIFLGGAMLAADHAKATPTLPLPTVPLPGNTVKADADTDKLKEDLRKANEKITALEKQVDKLTELLTGKKDDKGFRLESDPGAVEEIKKLKNTIATLEGEIRTLKSTSLKPAVVPEAPKAKGTVKIINEYPIEISMIINEKSTYRVAAGTTLDVEVPAGPFSYQLLQSGAPATRSEIKEKEIVKLRIK